MSTDVDSVIEKLRNLEESYENLQAKHKQEIKELKQRFHKTLIRIRESRASGKLRGIIPEIACILEEEINSYD